MASPYERARVRQALQLLEWDLAEYRSATFGVAVAAAAAAESKKQGGEEGGADAVSSFIVAMPPPQQLAAKATLGARPDPSRVAHPLDMATSKSTRIDSATGAGAEDDHDDGALSSLWRLYVGAGRMLLRKYARENRLAIEHDYFDRAKRAAEASHSHSRSPSVGSPASSRASAHSRGRRGDDPTRAARHRRHRHRAAEEDDAEDEEAAANEERQTIAAAALARLSGLGNAREAKLIRGGGSRRPSSTSIAHHRVQPSVVGPSGSRTGSHGSNDNTGSNPDDLDEGATWADLSSAQRVTLALQLFLLYACVPLAVLGALHSLLLPPLALSFAAACLLSPPAAAASFGCSMATSVNAGNQVWPLDALTTVLCAAHCVALCALLPLAWRALAFQRRAWPVRMFGVDLEEGTADRLIAYHAALRHFEALRPLLENEGGLPADVAELVLRFMPAPEMDCVADLQYRMLLPVYAQAYAQAEEDAQNDDGYGDDKDEDDDDQSQVSRRAPLSQSASGWSDSTFAD